MRAQAEAYIEPVHALVIRDDLYLSVCCACTFDEFRALVDELAGKRRGTEDDRYLWPEMLRAIREIRPEWVVGENVYGFVNWSNGLVFDTMWADLENAGYQVGAFILPAAAVGAPHRRDRVWVVAHRSDAGSESMRERQDGVFSGNHAADPDGERCDECQSSGQSEHPQERNSQDGDAERRIPGWGGFPTQSPVCGGDDGISAELDGITFPAWCRQSIKAFGNAIVPQVAWRIFDAINKLNR